MATDLVVEAQVAACGADAKVIGWEVLQDDLGLVPHVEQPTPDGKAISLRPLFTLALLPSLLAGGVTVRFERRVLEVGAFDYQCLPTLAARELDADLLAWGAYQEGP